MIYSKLTSKNQATIPKEIRDILNVKSGDRILFEVVEDGEEVVIRKASPIDKEYAKALSGTLEEWDSKYDEDAYRDL